MPDLAEGVAMSSGKTTTGPAPSSKSGVFGRLAQAAGFWPLVPALVFLAIALVLPLCVLLSFGFLELKRGVVSEGSFSFAYYLAALGDPTVWTLAWRSAWIAVATVVLTLLLGYPLAYVYTLVGPVTRRIILLVVVAPLLTSILVRIFAWYVILGGRRGILNAMLLGAGVIDTPLRILNTQVAVLVGMVQVHLPFMILPLIAVLADRDRAVEEASTNLGAGRVQTFLRITLPMSLPGIVAGAALVLALAYTTFVIPQLLGGGNYATLPVAVYEQTVIALDWTKGAVLAGLLLVSCFGLVLLVNAAGARAMRWNEGRPS
jgi:ABC-type spermidine/putrescine transport system permease subunit I